MKDNIHGSSTTSSGAAPQANPIGGVRLCEPQWVFRHRLLTGSRPPFSADVTDHARQADVDRHSSCPRAWLAMPCYWPNVALDAFVVMPNHIPRCSSANGRGPGEESGPYVEGDVIGGFKGRCQPPSGHTNLAARVLGGWCHPVTSGSAIGFAGTSTTILHAGSTTPIACRGEACLARYSPALYPATAARRTSSRKASSWTPRKSYWCTVQKVTGCDPNRCGAARRHLSRPR